MRIAYVTIHVAPEIMLGGVGKKINTQLNLWREMEHDANLFCLTAAHLPFDHAKQFVFTTVSKTPLAGIIRRELDRSARLRDMLVAIRNYRPDLIYLRFGLYSYPLHVLFEIAPVVLETNSDDNAEYRRRGLFFYWMNRATRNLTFGRASGLIVPSHELVGTLVLGTGRPVSVISNGLDMNKVEALPPANNTSPVITLVGSPGMEWHGVDKLVKLAWQYPDLAINVVGYSKNDIKGPIPENMYLHGFLNKDQVREVLLKTDVACGSLALHRNHMEEASVLKVREALAYGVPVILAYKDTDLHQIDMDTILRIPNTEDNVLQHAGRIRDFAYRMMGRRVDIASLVPYLDQRLKEKDRLTFFQKVLRNDAS